MRSSGTRVHGREDQGTCEGKLFWLWRLIPVGGDWAGVALGLLETTLEELADLADYPGCVQTDCRGCRGVVGVGVEWPIDDMDQSDLVESPLWPVQSKPALCRSANCAALLLQLADRSVLWDPSADALRLPLGTWPRMGIPRFLVRVHAV
jgi:hypothetical protein